RSFTRSPPHRRAGSSTEGNPSSATAETREPRDRERHSFSLARATNRETEGEPSTPTIATQVQWKHDSTTGSEIDREESRKSCRSGEKSVDWTWVLMANVRTSRLHDFNLASRKGEEVKKENPNANFMEISNILGAKWKTISPEEKKSYEIITKEKHENEAMKLLEEEQKLLERSDVVFFGAHPSYASNPFFITGESYACY
ncbi:hypothetical protein Dimus_033472, partial [Dionaea muscipula]